MRFEIPYWYCQKYLSTNRHRKPRSHMMKAMAEIDVPELSADEFPIAMIVKDWKSIYDGAKTREDFENDRIWKYCLIEEEVRVHSDKLLCLSGFPGVPLSVQNLSRLTISGTGLKNINHFKWEKRQYRNRSCWKMTPI